MFRLVYAGLIIGAATLAGIASLQGSFAVAWPATVLLLIGVAAAIGNALNLGAFGILFDTRGRYSLSRLQLMLWSIVVISLIASVAALRCCAGANALTFTIPEQLLVVMGISLGSTVLAGAAKTAKDTSHPNRVAASMYDAEESVNRPRWVQLFLVEEGAGADEFVDVTKFQNFLLSLVVLAAYVATVFTSLIPVAPPCIGTLPELSSTMLILLAASHAGYVAGKLPTPDGEPRSGATVANRPRRKSEETPR